jgi:hypothetical protein
MVTGVASGLARLGIDAAGRVFFVWFDVACWLRIEVVAAAAGILAWPGRAECSSDISCQAAKPDLIPHAIKVG